MSIFSHVCLGTNDMARATRFYDAVLGALGVRNMGPLGARATLYGKEAPSFIVITPADGGEATHANGGTVGFAAANRAAVNAFHAAGLAAGGSCEGEPGPRAFAPNAYAAYLRDPDGNKICTYCFAAE